MVHLLIDNCSLLQLSNINGYNNYLIQLEDHINNGELILITHNLILEEWERHKLKDKERKERKLLFLSKQKEQIQNDATNLLPTIATVNTNHLDLQVQQIDNILAKAKVLNTPEGIKNEVAERIRKKLAPFHNKVNSLNDWEIIGSACAFCENYAIWQLDFLSNNHTDFADKDDINRKIHPTLQERFSKIAINYFKNYSDLF